MIEIKNSCCLHHVSGGNYSEGDPNCPGCRGDWDDVGNRDTFSPAPINATTIGGIAGGFWGPKGVVTGSIVGYIIDSTDFNAMGENYKDYIIDQINQGYLPAD